MKKLFFLVLMTICTCAFGQLENEKIYVSDSTKQIITIVEKADNTLTVGDSLTVLQLRQLYSQLLQMNTQIVDSRNDFGLMSRRRQSALIQGFIGATAATTGALLLPKYGTFGYAFLAAGGVLCITSVITWICSYTPMANNNLTISRDGVVYRF
ncbi:MAG: hypothetical protein II415_00920 [Bacteroidaceae bacterium]|nr:hypothetical protein [Bacteroidaceae bacterium]